MIDETVIIESIPYSARVNLASGTRSFITAVKNEPAYQSLLDQAKEDYLVALRLLGRAIKLMHKHVDTRYANPQDAAIATYIMILKQVSEAYSWAADILAFESEGLWWAQKVANLEEV